MLVEGEPAMAGETILVVEDGLLNRKLIVALAAHAMVDKRERAVAAGCDGHITKPIDPRTLPGQMRQYLDSRGEGTKEASDVPGETEIE